MAVREAAVSHLFTVRGIRCQRMSLAVMSAAPLAQPLDHLLRMCQLWIVLNVIH